MADFDIQVDELCMLYEYQQGTLFNGLEYFDTVEESLGLSTPTYIVFVDELAETIGFSGSYAPVHMLVLLESLGLEEQFGFPSQVSATSLEVIHGQVVRPVDVCYFGLEVLHGIDIFWEEVSSGLHGTSDAKGVPYHWFTMYESFEVLDEDIVVKVTFSTVSDFFNMRHTVEQLYNFNNFIGEQLFIYGWPGLAWGKLIEDGCLLEDSLFKYLGFSLIEYLFGSTKADSGWIGSQVLDSKMFVYDTNKQIQGFTENMVEALALIGVSKVPWMEKLLGNLTVSDNIEQTRMSTTMILNETLQIEAIVTVVLRILAGINDKFVMNESSVLATVIQDYMETIQDGFAVSIETVFNFVLSQLMSDIITGTDSSLSTWYLDLVMTDSMNLTEEIK